MPRFQPLEPATVDGMQRFVETSEDSYAVIGARFGVSASTVGRYKEERGWRRPGEGLPGPVAQAMRRAGNGPSGESPSAGAWAGGPSADGPSAGPWADAGSAGAGPDGAGAPGAPAREAPAAQDAVPAAERRRAVLDRLWAVVERQTMRLEAATNDRAQAALSRDVALLVRVAETLARVVRDWPPEPAAGPQRSLAEIDAEICRRLTAFYGTDPPTPEELEHA